MTGWPRGAPRPGDRAELSGKVEAADIELFTRISGDRNPLHYDEGAARASRFGEITVSRQDGTVVLEGTAVCYTASLD